MESKSNSASDEVTTEVEVVEVEGGGSKAVGSSGEKLFEYFGWVHHLRVNSIGHEYRHLRFLQIKGKYAFMYKKDPHENPGTKPIRRGVISHALMVEDLGRRRINYDLELYVLGLFNRLDGTKKGEIACAEPGDVRNWMDAFDQAKEQAEYDLLRGGTRQRLSTVDELNLEGHRPRVRRGLQKLVRIGKGPEFLLRQTSESSRSAKLDPYGEVMEDAIDIHNWKCVCTMNGIRFFEDAAESKVKMVLSFPQKSKSFLVKSVGIVDGSSDAVFEAVLSLEQHRRCEWDALTADIELVTTIDGHYDIIHGTYNRKYLSRWFSKTDFVFSRQWIRSQDGSYTILQAPAVHKECPKKSGYQRIKIHPSTWEIRELESSHSSTKRCLVTQMLEIHCSFWDRWKIFRTSKFERTIPFALLCQVAGLKEYFSVHPVWNLDSTSTVGYSTSLNMSTDNIELPDVSDEFYDAIADGDLLEDEDSDDDDNIELPKRGQRKLKNISWSIAGLGIKIKPASVASRELDTTISPVAIDVNQFRGSLNQSKSDTDKNCWSSPTGKGFVVRGRTYAKDFTKIVGGEPLLKLIAVDWLKAEQAKDGVALHPKSLLQSDAGKKLPFALVINLMVPANPNHNLVLYYGAELPVRNDSLLGKFVNGSNTFRDSRFKLIPRIVQGYWMVKRAVGAKACLLGKAVTCRYLRQDNFLEIDVDIGSSSVARSIISLVLGYVTSIVVDLAILIEGKEEEELPEYILGTVRLSCLKPESAVTF